MNDKHLPKTIAEIRGDNTLWTPEQMLTRALEHIRAGEVTAESALLIFIKEDEDGGFTTETYRANLRRDREIALIAAKQYACVRDWFR